MQKLYRKHAKDYHSSDEEEVSEEAHTEPVAAGSTEDPAASSGSDEEAAVDADAQSDDELEEDGPHQGMTKLAEGSRAFKLTFSKIMKNKLPNEPLGLVSAHKSLVAEKLAEEATEYKAKAETKRLKQYNLCADKENGSYNFEGRYDLVRFIKTVQNAGLYAHIRSGPYVCAEWNFGGFPVWLKYVPGINFRSDNEPFKAVMQGFMEKIVRMMKSERLYESFRLKSCEPEFLVSTPERLLELVSVGAIGISGTLLLVFDGLKDFVGSRFQDKVKSIRESISGDNQIVIFGDCFGKEYAALVQNLLRGPTYRLSQNDSVVSQHIHIPTCAPLHVGERKITQGLTNSP